jgi:hypothetical protein
VRYDIADTAWMTFCLSICSLDRAVEAAEHPWPGAAVTGGPLATAPTPADKRPTGAASEACLRMCPGGSGQADAGPWWHRERTIGRGPHLVITCPSTFSR